MAKPSTADAVIALVPVVGFQVSRRRRVATDLPADCTQAGLPKEAIRKKDNE